jgi:hypothetical protein
MGRVLGIKGIAQPTSSTRRLAFPFTPVGVSISPGRQRLPEKPDYLNKNRLTFFRILV